MLVLVRYDDYFSNTLLVFYVHPQFKVCPKSLCVSTPGHRTDLFLRDLGSVLITDFFGSVRKVEITMDTVNLTEPIQQMEQRYTVIICLLLYCHYMMLFFRC